jgi:hypothetical protein
MPHIITHYLPELDEPERSFLAQLTATMPEAGVQQFAIAYRQGRRDPQTVLLMAAIGIAGELCLKSQRLLLDTVSTTCDSGWVKSLGFKINRNFAY